MKVKCILLLTLAIFCSAFADDLTTTEDPGTVTTSAITTTSTTSTTTTTPATTTTTPATTTTTPATTTTTPATTTTTSTPATTTTTTPETTTTVAPPTEHWLYNITEKNVTCIMLDGKLSIKVTYNISENSTNISTVELPKPSSAINVTGTCDGVQYIEIAWGHMYLNSIRISFEEIKDKKAWHVSNFTSTIYLDPKIFVNASDAEKVLESDIVVTTNPMEIPVNHSFKCYSTQTFNNVTTTKEGGPYPYPLELMVDGFQIQAFNKISHQTKFLEEIHCDADKIADVVPIAVGCALAALVVVVLIAYIIGRRRRSAAYQSV